MLEEKLRQASQTHAKSSKRMFMMLAIAVCSIAVVVAGILFFDLASPSQAPEVAVAIESTAPQDASKLREQFKQQLRAYETDIAPMLADANLKAWNANKEQETKALKDSATASFATGDYMAALQSLTSLESLAKQMLAQREDIFSSQFTLAEKALAAEKTGEAKLRIGKALQVKPDNPEALKLAQRIDALPKILALLKQAAIAQTENNPEKEYAAVVEAFKLAPDRPGLKQRKQALAEQIRESQFAPLITLGLEQVKKTQLRAARGSYDKAKRLYPGRSELHVLHEAIGKLAIRLDLDAAIRRGKAAIAQDNWDKAQSVYAAAVQRHPDNKAILDGLQLSNKLVSLHRALASYISRPERLSARNVGAGAQQTLDQTRIFARNSISLSRKSDTLRNLLVTANVKIPVTVTSDNQTYILVRGVGKVGLTEERTIQLKPGIYTFEGLREGYKSKLVEVRIPIGSRSFGVKVVCDERI